MIPRWNSGYSTWALWNEATVHRHVSLGRIRRVLSFDPSGDVRPNLIDHSRSDANIFYFSSSLRPQVYVAFFG